MTRPDVPPTDRPHVDQGTVDADTTEIIRVLLSELELTRHPNRSIGPRMVKRLLQAVAAKIGHPVYLTEAEFARICEQAGIPIEPRTGHRIRPTTSWWLGLRRRSVQRFVAKHGVRGC